MPYEIRVIDDEEIVSVRLSGRVEVAEHVDARRDTLRLCEEKETIKILVDLVDLTSSMATFEAYDFGSTFGTDGATVPIIMAVVLPRDPRVRKDVQFIITVARNRGSQVDEFDDEDKAREWLHAFGKVSQ
ncbi:MAG: hypothetical protein JSW58_15195 [Candidatus Latescibacterota bacterium]|nr:MAG: hypothetical protein JSW58_15195 [Candidatus Latescibacterota bacterium]